MNAEAETTDRYELPCASVGVNVDLRLGDCLDVLPTLEAGSVDAIITDLPYGTTNCAWDSLIPLEPMWAAVRRVLKPSGVFVTTASQPFTSVLVMSNLDWFKYELVYEKTNAKGFLAAAYKPLAAHENILIFSAGTPTYNAQKWRVPEYIRTKRKSSTRKNSGEVYGRVDMHRWMDDGERQPTSVVSISNHAERQDNYHPTQKPVELMSYLVATYTNPGDRVLDFAMGSGTTGASCCRLQRNFIGIERDPGYFAIAERRIEQAQAQLAFDFTAKKDI